MDFNENMEGKDKGEPSPYIKIVHRKAVNKGGAAVAKVMPKDHRYRYKFTILKKKLSERGRLGIANSLILLTNYGGQDQAIKRSYSPGEVRCIFGINNISCVPEYSSLNHVAQMVCDPVEWRRMQEDDIAQKIENINRWNNETQQFNHHCYDQSELMSLYMLFKR